MARLAVSEAVLVLIKDHPSDPSEAMAVSMDIEVLIDDAVLEDMTTAMHPLRDIGVAVVMDDGDTLRIEESKMI